MCGLLQEYGVFVNATVSPAVPKGRELLRTSYMATHTEEQLDRILDAFKRAGRKLGVI
jgi:8-amino-7-oxononanoate synthase